METLEGAIISYANDYIGEQEKHGNMGFKTPSFDAEIRKYTPFINGQAWCVYFTWLCWAKSYEDFSISFDKARSNFYGGAVRTFRHFKKAGWTSKQPKVGSIAIWQKYSKGKATSQGHAAIVEVIEDEYIFTIEGNTNSAGGREGVEVSPKKRDLSFTIKDGLVLKGFIHPKQD